MDDANQIPAAAAPSSTGTDWLRLATMSDEDIARAVTNDPDAAPILDAERMRREYHPHAARLPQRVVASSFEWDEVKNRSNIEKHGIDFADAVRIFASPTLDRVDQRGDHAEARVNSIGDLDGLTIINVTHTDRSGNVRLISARRANRLERELYETFIREASMKG